MTTSTVTSRVPLRFPSATATFLIAIAGYLGVNLSPYMISATQAGLGVEVTPASWIITGTLLFTAVAGLAAAPLCAGPHRRLVTRIGLLVGVIGFTTAALAPATIVPMLFVGGLGAGGAVAGSGAALAAFDNPDRVSGFNGLANRGVITIVLAVIPMIGLAPINVFGTLALFSLAGLAVSIWLPTAPVAEPKLTETVEHAVDEAVHPHSLSGKRIALAGITLLVTFALWAASEDSLWAMAGLMGSAQAGLTEEGLGIALSGATAGGLLGAIALMVFGSKMGRAVPLVVLLLLGGGLKIVEGFVTDPTLFIVVFIAWNTMYAIAFFYFVAASAALDATGKWSGPLFAVYLIGSALTPVIGAALVGALGYQGFAITLGVASFVLAVPAWFVARTSTIVETTSPEASK